MIRPALAADAAAIAAVWNPIIRDTVVTFNPVEKSGADIIATLAARAAEGNPFFVAEAEGQVLGFASYFQFRAGLGYARTMEHSINLSEQARGRGLGRQLMAALEEDARAQGHRSLIGAVSASNHESLRFHERLGYTEAGRLRDAGWKFGRFHDLVLMQKLL
ncbi:GNAT family N-acetyltransferase [Pararhodobacter sp.]|uniref:GNAT family N-acetyltransferase n=1 Tax=Pararhodobacter sp. TaxID=2127056 RepID=UPI002FDE9883